MQASIVPPPEPKDLPPLLNVREILTLVVALALIVATALLGRWQLGRAEYKKALTARIAERMEAKPLEQGPLALNFEPNVWRHVVAKGEYASSWTIYLQNRQYNNQPGFWVLTPLRLGDSQVYVMVMRGWVPRNFDAIDLLPKIATPKGTVEVDGRLAPAPSQLFSFAKDPPGAVIRQNVQIGQFAKYHHIQMLPYVIQELGANAKDGLVRSWPQPDVGMDTNYGYAFQWFSMTALGLGLTIYFLSKRIRQRLRQSSRKESMS
ncbi:MAG: hypothetical protein B7X46_09325 [Thiomonas sp. 15-66-11]|jgi:cytochrome oxidase assembly protein ShyY1|nr:SURF1 family protein [Thiomonas sp.]OZB44330.1 MAG: hypothetical protein B7X46_09325 [Thiomonas sp. 15-66-11]